jgi:hypothetical protein
MERADPDQPEHDERAESPREAADDKPQPAEDKKKSEEKGEEKPPSSLPASSAR